MPLMPDLCTPWTVPQAEGDPVELTWAAALALCTGVDPADLSDLTDEQKAEFLAGAQRWLWWRTGQRYGACQATLTTVYRTCRCRRSCGCDRGRIDLSLYGPVQSIDELKLAGDAKTEGTDFVLVGSAIVRLPIGTVWSSTVDLEVTFTYGETPPVDLVLASGILAVNDALSCQGVACELPKGTRSLSAEGMSIEVDNPDTWTKEGNTGIRRVDRVLARWPFPISQTAGVCDPAAAGPIFDRTA